MLAQGLSLLHQTLPSEADIIQVQIPKSPLTSSADSSATMKLTG